MEFEKVRDIIVETLGCDAEEVKPEASLADDLGADSLDLVDLTMSIEEEFDLPELPEEAIRGMETEVVLIGEALGY